MAVKAILAGGRTITAEASLNPHRWILAALLPGLAACQTLDGAPSSAPEGDLALFESEVQPVIQRDCAFLGCHGREGLSLALYAVDYLRMIDPEGRVDPDRPVLDERALSNGELEHNRLAIASRKAADDPDAERFLRRLLPPEEGGIPHADGTIVYGTRSASGHVALRRFMETVHAP